MVILEKFVNASLLASEVDQATDPIPPETRLLVLEKLEGAVRRFTYSLLNEATMNLRNVLIQNLFKVFGRLRARYPALKARCIIVEFFNRELEEQLDTTIEPFKKAQNLKALLNLAVCMNGSLTRVYEQGQLGGRNLFLPQILHSRAHGQIE